MLSMSLFKKPEEEIVAVFDIGNGSVGGALVKLNTKGRPILLYTHREPLTFAPHPTPKYLVSSMVKLLKSVAQHLAKDGLSHIKTSPFAFHKLRDAYCIFSSPWYISQTKIIRDEWAKQTTISYDVVNTLIEKEQDQFTKALQEGRYQLIFGPDTRLLEKRIVNVRLNGYTIENPVGKQARQLELTLFTSYISQDIVSKVENTLHSAFGVRSIHHYSYGLASWGTAQRLFPDIHDYLFIDVSGETTDVSLIIKDIFIETVSFPIGRSTLIRKIVRDLNIAPDVALSYAKMYYTNALDTAFKKKMESTLSAVEIDWHDDLIVALQKFQKIYALPRATLVTADLDTSKLFLNALAREYPSDLNIAKSSLTGTYIGADTVQQYIEVLPRVPLDPFLSTESIFLNTLFSHDQS